MTDTEIHTRTSDGALGWWIWMLDAAKVGMSQDFHRYEKLWSWIYDRITKRAAQRDAELAALKSALVPRRGVIAVSPISVGIIDLKIGKVTHVYAIVKHDGTPDGIAAAIIAAAEGAKG